MKIFGTLKPLKSKLEDSLKRIEELENHIKADKTESDKLRQVIFNLELKVANVFKKSFLTNEIFIF
jgi:hypothetical protein